MTSKEKFSKSKKWMWAWIVALLLNTFFIFNNENIYFIILDIVCVIISILALYGIYLQWKDSKKEIPLEEIIPPQPVPMPVCISPSSIYGYDFPKYNTTIIITNNNDDENKIELFDRLNDFYLPPNILIEVVTKKEVEGIVVKEMKSTYKEFCISATNSALYCDVKKTSDNRKLSFYYLNLFEGKQPVVPQLTIDKKKRTDDDIWNPEEYNIADTQEAILINGLYSIGVKLSAKETFNIEFNNLGIETFSFGDIKN